MTLTAETYHVPVLLSESIDGLNIQAGRVFVDVTFGGGGHSAEIIERMTMDSRLFAFDQDADAEANAFSDKSIFKDSRFYFIRSNFHYLKNWMRYHGIEHIDGLLADLGVSSHHFDDESRGFSFRFDAPLDMRMNKRAETTAADIVNNYSEEQLADLFYLYGELKNARKIASTLVKAREKKRISSTGDLLKATECCFNKERLKKDAARLFQSLRIEVNQEMTALEEMLNSATQLLASGGRLSVITYHSLEDRMVKNLIKTGNTTGKVQQDFFGNITTPLRAINTKPIVPCKEEQELNPRSRSAKLRIAEKR